MAIQALIVIKFFFEKRSQDDEETYSKNYITLFQVLMDEENPRGGEWIID